MYDTFGVPSHPIIFQVLMVLTFALHIIFVNLTWASSFLAFYFNLKKEENYINLSKTLKKSIPSLFSVAMLLGIAPLLFIQTIYDYFWYNSNIFSGIFVILFIFVLMLAFSFLYIYYLSEKAPNWLGLLSFLLISFAGITMHILNIQMLKSNKWATFWHPSSFGKLNSFEFYRFLHFFLASFALVGFFILINSWYLKKKQVEEEVVNFRAKLGFKIFFVFTILQAISGIWWLLMIPGKFKFYFDHFFIFSLLLFLILLHFMIRALKDPLKYFWQISINLFILLLFMAINRESLRSLYLKEAGFNLSQYPLNIHIPSFILFLVTFILAIFVAFFMLTVVYKGGLKKEKLEETKFIKMAANFSILGLLVWLGIVVLIGIYIYVKNL